ncbi:MAG TPA: hypothetical protein VFA81_06610 [Burkholderiales bacterium]|nr:hypothetical protein [Burkholderiales bacterium]
MTPNDRIRAAFEAWWTTRKPNGDSVAQQSFTAGYEFALNSLRPEGGDIMPLAPYMALRVILNHIEPGWENCRAELQRWFDSLPRPTIPPAAGNPSAMMDNS